MNAFARTPLALLLLAFLATGCGSDDDDGADDTVPGAEDVAGDDPLGAGGPTTGDDVERRVTAVVRDLLDAVDGLASAPVPPPRVVIETTPSLIFYASADDGERFVVAPRWSDLDEERALFERWAGATGGAFDGRALFEELFNWFFVAHEVGHHLQSVSGRGPESRWDEELQANEIAVAHFAATEPARLEALVAALASVRDSLEVPDGAGDPAFFEAEYEAIGDVPEVYGYFQFGFVLDAFGRVDELDLGTIVREDLAL